MLKTLRLILGDQLNSNHSWFQSQDENVLYLMAEMRQETDYVKHHIQKVMAFFAAMREFAGHLKSQGHQVKYFKLEDPENPQKLDQIIEKIIQEEGISKFEYQLPDELRLDQQLQEICKNSSIESAPIDTEHFLTERTFLAQFFEGKKTYLMESFYREIRKKHKILMDGKEPEGGKWNYDQDNRSALTDKRLLRKQREFNHDLTEIFQLIQNHKIETFGNVDPKDFPWPISRAESLDLLDEFCQNLLLHFGDYQDALTTWDPYLFHSRLSFALNTKMISPLEVVKKVEAHWHGKRTEISISQVEGFIRQIIGWREYMRGIYWATMPEFSEMNFFGHNRKLPSWFWTGKTKMKCLAQSINQSLDLAYAHHIQRLMVIGNFALLTGIDPNEVDSWYLGIYIDAIEWVEITNTRGMSQFADGGIVGTKPYVSSANYIKKQGNYCSHCAYSSHQKTGDKACPFNSLYWHFFNRNRELLEKNPRIGMAYKTWDRMKERSQILKQADNYLERIEEL